MELFYAITTILHLEINWSSEMHLFERYCFPETLTSTFVHYFFIVIYMDLLFIENISRV